MRKLFKALGWSTLVAVGALLVVVFYQVFAWDRANQRAAESIAVALQEHKARTGRYPQRLQELVPGFMPALPPAAHKRFPITYWVDSDATQCAVAYEVHNEYEIEFDCNAGSWREVSLYERQKGPRRDVQYIWPEGIRREMEAAGVKVGK